MKPAQQHSGLTLQRLFGQAIGVGQRAAIRGGPCHRLAGDCRHDNDGPHVVDRMQPGSIAAQRRDALAVGSDLCFMPVTLAVPLREPGNPARIPQPQHGRHAMRPGAVLLQLARAQHLPGELKHAGVVKQVSAQRHVRSWVGNTGEWPDGAPARPGREVTARNALGIGAKMA